MKSATIKEAKERLEELIEAARSGEPVEITDDGQPVVSLTPSVPGAGLASASGEVDESRDAIVRRLESAGVVHRNPRMPDAQLLEKWGLSDDAIGLLQALLDEREENM